MTPELLAYLRDPITKEPLTLSGETIDAHSRIISGTLRSPGGAEYPITDGIPRMIARPELRQSVESFGDEWNHFNFTDFKASWLHHAVGNSFGSTAAFKDRLIVDAGGGSGAQTLWMLESGARHVIMLDLSHSVDDVVQRNLQPSGFTNYDVVQCSIDEPPLADQSINGMVICHNVIQHTPSVEKTARALFALVAPGSEFVFNCYPRDDRLILRWVRFHLIYRPLRVVLSRQPFWVILAFARTMSRLRLIPGLGGLLEKAGVCLQGEVPVIPGETFRKRLKRRYKAAVLNTFDNYGSHKYQHHLSEEELLNHAFA